MRKVFLANGEPAIHGVDFIPRALIERPFTGDDLAGNISAFLEESAGERATYYVAEPLPTVAGGSIAQWLAFDPSTLLLLFDEVTYNVENRAVSCPLLHHGRGGTLQGSREKAIMLVGVGA